MLENATRICDAKFGVMWLCEDGGFRAVALHGPTAHVDERRRDPLIYPEPKTPLARIARSRQIVHITDIRTEPAYVERLPTFVGLVDAAGARTFLAVPMLKENELIGAIAIYRQEVRPFTEKQIELVKNFASQAVIAIENTRLLNELRKSLQQQTATADVLEGHQPLGLRSAGRCSRPCSRARCGFAKPGLGFIYRFDGEAPPHGGGLQHACGVQEVDGGPSDQARPGQRNGRAALERRTVHIPDVQADPEYSFGAKDVEAFRTVLTVPMLKGDELLGVILTYRLEVRPFTDKQIELVETFADQAVIAIENVRLFDEVQARTRELSEALEQQTATAEVLQVISSSPGELEPVFQAMLANATRSARPSSACSISRRRRLPRRSPCTTFRPPSC